MRRYLFALCCLMTLTVNAQVKYLERSWNAEKREVTTLEKTCTSFKEITGSQPNIRENFESGWYVVKGNVNRFQFRFKGEVHLILTDGCQMGFKQMAIQASDKTKLHIHSQSDGENQGKIVGYNDYFDLNAVIGGVEQSSMGSLYIHGGDISATQKKGSGAAIGGGEKGQIDPKSEIVIYGGKVNAENQDLDAGIGGGYTGDQGGAIIIYGGTVNAKSGNHGTGAGIGGGHGGKGGTVKIYGGQVTARGGLGGGSAASGIGGAGIGGTQDATATDDVCDVHIYGGEVYAYGGRGASGIGGTGSSNGVKLEVTGGTVFASGYDDDSWIAPGIGGGMYGNIGKVTITGGTVMAVTRQTTKLTPAPIGPGSYWGGHLYYSKGELILGDNMRVSYSAHQDAIKEAKYREGEYLHTVSTSQREQACMNHTYTFVRIESCHHPSFTYICKDDEKHVRHCTLCNYQVEEPHKFQEGKCVCGKAEGSDYWTVTLYHTTDGKTYMKGEEYLVIKGMETSLPAPPAIEGLSFQGYLPSSTGAPTDIEMKDIEKSSGQLIGAGNTFQPDKNTSYYARYRHNFKESWEWNDDYTAATLTLTNSKTGETTKLNATVTEDTQSRVEPTETSLGEAYYTAVVNYAEAQGITYRFENRQKVTLFQPRIIILDAFATNGENSALLEKYEGFQAEVTINNLTLKKDGKLHAICLPFSLTDLNNTPLEGATLYKYFGYSIAEGKMTIEFSRTMSMEAGKPYFYQFRNVGAEVAHPTFPLVVIGDTDGSGNYEADFDLVGGYEVIGFADELRDKIAVLNANEIVHNEATVDAFSCYFYIVPSFKPDGSRRVCTLSLEFDKSDGLVFTKKLYDSWSGDGTEASPYIIMNDQQLTELQADMSATDAARLKGKYFRQGANIMFDKSKANNMAPIRNFKAHYNGAGFTISGVNISLQSDQNAALFEGLNEGATVKNVILYDSFFKGWNAAPIASSVLGGSVIENCHVLKDVTVEGSTWGGGIIHIINNSGSTVKDCSSQASVKGGSGAGGIVGFLTGGTIVDNIYLGNTVTANSSSNAIIGGRQSGYVGNCYFIAPTLTDARAKLMPQYDKDIDNTHFFSLMQARDEFLLANTTLSSEQIGYDITLNKRSPLTSPQQTGGKQRSIAYSVCLPFRMTIPSELQDGVKVYKLHEVDLKNKVLQFTNEFPILMAGEPYIVVVSKGELALSASNTLIAAPKESLVVKNADATKEVGWWKGTFKKLDNKQLVAERAYFLQRNGTFRCSAEKYPDCYINPFVGYFSSMDPLEFQTFKLKYIRTENGEEQGDVTDFPADEFEAEFDLDDITGIRIADRNERMETDNCYDLQGRRINGKPRKGLYIQNGKKIVIR